MSITCRSDWNAIKLKMKCGRYLTIEEACGMCSWQLLFLLWVLCKILQILLACIEACDVSVFVCELYARGFLYSWHLWKHVKNIHLKLFMRKLRKLLGMAMWLALPMHVRHEWVSYVKFDLNAIQLKLRLLWKRL